MFNIEDLVDILGYPMMDKLSQEVLSKNGFIPGYKEKQLRVEGSVNLGVRDWGIELAFDDRDHYSESYAVPKAPGDAVFTSIFIEPAYTNGFSSFAFPKALDIKGCNVRDEALKRFGVLA